MTLTGMELSVEVAKPRLEPPFLEPSSGVCGVVVGALRGDWETWFVGSAIVPEHPLCAGYHAVTK